MKKILLLTVLTVITLAGCSWPTSSSESSVFYGEKGEKVEPVEGIIYLPEKEVSDGQVHYYNVAVGDFFVVKSSDGHYRTVANACQVYFCSNLGFRQEGNYIVCNTCGNQYPLIKIATEKGGCNPGPINPDIPVVDGQLMIDIKDVAAEDVVGLFI